MAQIPNAKDELAKTDPNDHATIFAIVAKHGGYSLTPEERYAALATIPGQISFLARLTGGALDDFFGTDRQNDPPAARPWKDGAPLESALGIGDLAVVAGLMDCHAHSAELAADILKFFEFVEREDAVRFVRLVLEPYARNAVDPCVDQDVPLVDGVLLAARTFLPPDDETARGVERWALMNRFRRLDFQAVLDEARTRGEDPLGRLTSEDAMDPAAVARATARYAHARLKEYGVTDVDLVALVEATVTGNAHGFLWRLDALATLLALPCMDMARERRARLLRTHFATRMLDDKGPLTSLGESRNSRALTALGEFGLWGGTPNEAIEDALIRLLAWHGYFHNVRGFLTVVAGSTFPCAIRGTPFNAEAEERHRASVDVAIDYLPTLMPRVYKRSVELGRHDVAGFLLTACLPGILDAPNADERETMLAAYARRPDSFSKPEPGSALFRKTFLPAT